VSLQEAQAKLPDLIANLPPGEELVIEQDGKPVAKLTAEPPARKPRTPGTLRGTVLYMAPDFDAPLDDFKEYME
jgi:antitoxin (DNA-binding transcriptional repressor) of toxin-antitoxin stability system